eukprot:30969-Pelagococcus_subviridis.AAC.10
MSARSFVIEITTAKTVTNEVMNRIGGDHENARPIAAVVAWCTPKLSRNPLTVAMMQNAASAERFSRSGGTE